MEVLHLEAGRSGVQVCHVRPVHHLHTARQAQQQRGLRGGAERDARLWVDVGSGPGGGGEKSVCASMCVCVNFLGGRGGGGEGAW